MTTRRPRRSGRGSATGPSTTPTSATAASALAVPNHAVSPQREQQKSRPKPKGTKDTDGASNGNRNAAKGSGNGQARSRYPKRTNPFTEAYKTPDLGGVIALSKNPRDVVLSFNPSDAASLLKSLEGNNTPDHVISYIKAKLAWTADYNAKL
jgi:hypothetical protein